MHLRQNPHGACEVPATRVPTSQPRSAAPGPSSTTSPHHSWPGISGHSFGQKPGKWPWMMCGSVPQIVTVRTLQSSS